VPGVSTAAAGADEAGCAAAAGAPKRKGKAPFALDFSRSKEVIYANMYIYMYGLYTYGLCISVCVGGPKRKGKAPFALDFSRSKEVIYIYILCVYVYIYICVYICMRVCGGGRWSQAEGQGAVCA